MDGFPELASPLIVCAVFGVVFAASVIQAGLGMGFGLMAAPLLALIDPEFVPAPTLMLGMVTAVWGAWRERTAIAWDEVGIGTIGRVAGVALATFVLAYIPDQRAFMLVFGLLVGLAVLLSISGWRIAFTRAHLVAMTSLSGLMATITSVGAPPLALLYQNRPSGEARPTLAAFFAVGCAVALVGLFVSGWAGSRQLLLATLILPPMLIGLLAARSLNRRFDRRYRTALLSISGMASLLLIFRGLT